MTRILATLGTLSMLAMAAALLIGLSIGDLYAKPLPDDATMTWARVHRLTGVAAALGVVLVESIIVTYFIGTSRWCKEVVDTYQLDAENVRNSNQLKRRTFPWALAGMLTVVGVISLGAAADPATGRQNTAAWTNWHLMGAFLGVGFIGWTYVAAWNNVFAQQQLIERVLGQVEEIRKKRGLDA